MCFATQAGQNDQAVADFPFGLAPQGQHGRIDRVVIVDAGRKARVAREEAKRLRLGFSEPAGRDIDVRAEPPGDRVECADLVFRREPKPVMAIFLEATIGQEVLRKLHVLPAIEWRQRDLAVSKFSREPDGPHRPLCIPIGFRIRVGRGRVIVPVGLVSFKKAGGFLIEVGGA